MNTYIALFRGINVGGKHILPMKGLLNILNDMECEEVRTYIQSGNVVFQNIQNKPIKMAEEISRKIFDNYGFKPKVFLLNQAELREAVNNNPFETTNGKALHFFFLTSHPESPDLEQLAAIKSESEEFKLIGKIFYLYAPDGIGRSILAAKAEQCLGVQGTGITNNSTKKQIQNLLNC